jgi:hypothetical protein
MQQHLALIASSTRLAQWLLERPRLTFYTANFIKHRKQRQIGVTTQARMPCPDPWNVRCDKPEMALTLLDVASGQTNV